MVRVIYYFQAILELRLRLTGSEDEQVLLGITIDSNYTFENHINIIYRKASQTLNNFSRFAPYMNIQKKRTSRFGYLPFVLMFSSTRLYSKINSIHERALRITYRDNTSTFQELLSKDNSMERFKIHQGLSPEILRETFVLKTSSYNLRRNDTFERRQLRSVHRGTKS